MTYIMIVVSLIMGLVNLFDIWSDILLTWKLYRATLVPKNELRIDYKMSLIVSILAIIAPFLVSHGCLISMKFAQGDYDQAAFENKSCFSKFAHFILLSVFGPFLFFFIEIIE